MIKLITGAMLALGLVSSARATATFGSTNVVYITGSTAFRAGLFETLTNNSSTPSVFDVGTPVSNPSGASSSTSAYYVVGKISGNYVMISIALTGSEAGLASLTGTTVTYTPPANSDLSRPSATAVTLAGTPTPTGFKDPLALANTIPGAAVPDLAFADTSVAVSLYPNANLVNHGLVAVIPFVWAKGYSSAPDDGWTNFLNVTSQTLPVEFNGAQNLAFFTGNPTHTNKVYLIGRNEGSGTRVNTLADQFVQNAYGVVKQYVASTAGYTNGILTLGDKTQPIVTNRLVNGTSGVHLLSVGGDGFDAGSGVIGTLYADTATAGLYTLGYSGLGDATSLRNNTYATIGGGGQLLTVDGVPENDGNVVSGAYHMWGHEYLYGNTATASDTTVTAVANALAGTTVNTTCIGFSTTGSASAAHANLGGATASARSLFINPALMHAERPSGSDYGFLGRF